MESFLLRNNCQKPKLSGSNRRCSPCNDRRAEKVADWKKSLIAGASACLVVLVINLGVTIWSAVNLDDNKNGSKAHRKVIYEGSCSTSRTLNIVIHLIINVFSSILLAVSNYGMQCLSAPTRHDIDQAHERGKWADVGILSFRNLRKISHKRAMLWWVLCISSVPLHLLFNSVVYSSLTEYNYKRFTVGDNSELLKIESPGSLKGQDKRKWTMIEGARSGRIDNLTNLECIDQYAIPFQTKRSDVLLITGQAAPSNEDKAYYVNPTVLHTRDNEFCPDSTYEWVCPSATCDKPCRYHLTEIKSQADDWIYEGKRVRYCLSQPEPQACKLNFNIYLAAIILGANAVKAVILAYMVFRPPKEPLFTLGDAVQSFLETPDAASRGSCLTSIDDFRYTWIRRRPPTIDSKPRLWGVAVSNVRWVMSLIAYIVAISVVIFLLVWGINNLSGPRDLTSLWNLGFGAATEVSLIQGLPWQYTGDRGLVWNVILSNLPQIAFSLLYFQYNGIFTCMATAKEWSDYGAERKGLRVSSNPKGYQRSRYFLQLPYSISMPLLLISILMHWMLSQSIFIVAVEYSGNEDAETQAWRILTCGYSPIAIIFVFITTIFMAALLIATALRRLPTIMPLAGSSSLAIAAACHHPNSMPQPEASLHPLKWGVMLGYNDQSGWRYTNHCGFSQYEVEKPREGVTYN